MSLKDVFLIKRCV